MCIYNIAILTRNWLSLVIVYISQLVSLFTTQKQNKNKD
jgi:hypothetical protein